jgi:hypothetical protein
MNLKTELGVVMLALTFVLASAYIASASVAGATDRDLKIVPVVSWSEPGTPIPSHRGGAVRVDRDFGAYHKNDLNQFGDDRAYDAANGRSNREADYQAHYWTPETYGLMGDYGYDSR